MPQNRRNNTTGVSYLSFWVEGRARRKRLVVVMRGSHQGFKPDEGVPEGWGIGFQPLTIVTPSVGRATAEPSYEKRH